MFRGPVNLSITPISGVEIPNLSPKSSYHVNYAIGKIADMISVRRSQRHVSPAFYLELLHLISSREVDEVSRVDFLAVSN